MTVLIQKMILKIGRKSMSKNNSKPIKLPHTNTQGKKVGSDAKACWQGYRYQGTQNGRDICVKVKK